MTIDPIRGSVSGGLQYVLRDPNVTKNDPQTLRFTIAFEVTDSGMPFVETYGWRLRNGRIQVPARKAGAQYVDQGAIGLEAQHALQADLKTWEVHFPEVRF